MEKNCEMYRIVRITVHFEKFRNFLKRFHVSFDNLLNDLDQDSELTNQ